MDRTDVLEKLARRAAIAAGELLSGLLDVADTAMTGFDADEVAFTLTWSRNTARMKIEFARFLRDILPNVLTALCAGDIDEYRAWMFYDVLRAADAEVAVRVAATVLPDAPDLTATDVRRKLRRVLLILDPSGAVARMRRTIVDRYVATSPSGHGTASLFGVNLPAARVTAAFERLDAYARGAKTAGDERTLEQLRADTFLDLLEGVTPTMPPVHRRGVVEIAVSLATVAGESAEPGELAGFGPIDAETTRDLLTELATRNDVDWRFSTRSDDGTLIGHGRIPRSRTKAGGPNAAGNGFDWTGAGTAARDQMLAGPPIEADPTRRTPSPALARWIIARDRTCRAPGCNAPARVCDIDHTIDHALGGLTSHDNLGLLCRHHHRLKHEGGWTLTQPKPGTFEWRSPDGHIYRK